MLILLAVILGVMWLLGFTVFHVASAAIHLLILVAAVLLLLHFIRAVGRSATSP
jgi:hypothetical protein